MPGPPSIGLLGELRTRLAGRMPIGQARLTFDAEARRIQSHWSREIGAHVGLEGRWPFRHVAGDR
jgi:hypothetical protein